MKTLRSQDEIARINVVQQLENLKEYPIVKEKLIRHELFIHGWFFDLDQNLLYEWDPERNEFLVVADHKPSLLTARILKLETS